MLFSALNEGPSRLISALSHDKVRLGSGLLCVQDEWAWWGRISVVFLYRECTGCMFTLVMEAPRDRNCNFSDHFLPLCFGLAPPCSLAVINSQDRPSEKSSVRVVRAADRQKNSSETKDHVWRSWGRCFRAQFVSLISRSNYQTLDGDSLSQVISVCYSVCYSVCVFFKYRTQNENFWKMFMWPFDL